MKESINPSLNSVMFFGDSEQGYRNQFREIMMDYEAIGSIEILGHAQWFLSNEIIHKKINMYSKYCI